MIILLLSVKNVHYVWKRPDLQVMAVGAVVPWRPRRAPQYWDWKAQPEGGRGRGVIPLTLPSGIWT